MTDMNSVGPNAAVAQKIGADRSDDGGHVVHDSHSNNAPVARPIPAHAPKARRRRKGEQAIEPTISGGDAAGSGAVGHGRVVTQPLNADCANQIEHPTGSLGVAATGNADVGQRLCVTRHMTADVGDQIEASQVSGCDTVAGSGEIGQCTCAHHHRSADLSDIILDIRHTYRLCRALHRQEKSLTLAIKAKERSAAVFRIRAAGGQLPEGKFPKPEPADVDLVAAEYPELFVARSVIKTGRRAHEKRLQQLAKLLPVHAWQKSVFAFGEKGLAIIIAEAGDLNDYATVSRLWKRMGLAPGQRRLKDVEAAAAAGYNPERRSAMWTLGDSLLKTNGAVYRDLYLARKAYELARAPEMTKMHAHRRAQRYVEKRLLKHLWQAWRGQALDGDIGAPLSPASAPDAGCGETSYLEAAE